MTKLGRREDSPISIFLTAKGRLGPRVVRVEKNWGSWATFIPCEPGVEFGFWAGSSSCMLLASRYPSLGLFPYVQKVGLGQDSKINPNLVP